MEIKLSDEGKWTRMELSGRLDAFSYEPIREKLTVVQKLGRRFVIIDVGDTEYISYQIAALLNKTKARLNSSDGDLKVEAKHANVLSKLEIFGGLVGAQ